MLAEDQLHPCQCRCSRTLREGELPSGTQDPRVPRRHGVPHPSVNYVGISLPPPPSSYPFPLPLSPFLFPASPSPLPSSFCISHTRIQVSEVFAKMEAVTRRREGSEAEEENEGREDSVISEWSFSQVGLEEVFRRVVEEDA